MALGFRAALLIFLLPLVPMVLGQWFFEAAQHRVDGPAELIRARSSATPAEPLQEVSARLTWFGMALLFLLLEIGVAGFSLWVVWRTSLKPWRWALMGAFALSVGVQLMVLAINREGGLSRAVFDFTWSGLSNADTVYPPGSLGQIGAVIGLINVLAVVSLTACWIGSVSLAGAVPTVTLSVCIKRLSELKWMFFATCLLLVVGVLHMSVWLNWGLSFLVSPDDGPAAQQVVRSITSFWGLVFSLQAVAGFLPLWFILRRHAEVALEASSTPVGEAEAKQLATLTDLSWAKVLVRILVVMAPAIIGQASSALDIFSS